MRSDSSSAHTRYSTRVQRLVLLLPMLCLAVGPGCGEKNANELCALADQVAADNGVDADKRGMEWVLRAHESNRDPRLSEAFEQMAQAGRLDR